MKEELRSSEGMDIRTTFVPDVDADDAKASGMLGMIGRVEAEESSEDRKAQPVMRTYQFTTEPILRDLQIPYVTVSEVDKIEGAIQDAVSSAFAWQNPICILFRGETLR